MNWWKKLFQQTDSEEPDYYDEGIELLRAGKYHEALTSFRLALRETPADTAVLQQIAIAYSRIGMTEEALRTYRTVLEKDPEEVGAHYGIAFLLLREGRESEAVEHLRLFLASAPDGPDAARHIMHARATLAELTEGRAAETEGEVY